jgi:hypothetical protein
MIICQEAMEQAPAAEAPEQDAAWVGAKGKVEAGWAAPLQPGRAEIVSARAVEQWSLTLQDSLATQEAAPNVVRQ